MIHERTTFSLNRAHAAQKLVFKLSDHRNKNCCVVAVSNGAAALAMHVARSLNGEVVFMPGEKSKNSADTQKSYAVAGLNYPMSDDLARDIPQEYIYRRTLALRSRLLSGYPGVLSPMHSKFQDRIVVLIDDFVQASDKMLAYLRIIRKLQPDRIIVATPVITWDAAFELVWEADSVVFTRAAPEDAVRNTYLDVDALPDEEIVGLVSMSQV